MERHIRSLKRYRHMFRTLICSNELNKDELIREKLQSWAKSGLQLVLLPCDPTELANLDLQQCLWIVTRDEEWELGTEKGIAMLPYVPELENVDKWNFCDNLSKLPSFPKAENIISGFESVDLKYLDRIYRREKNLPWIIAETEEFVLRELTLQDMDGLFRLYEDETLYPYVEPLFEYDKELEYEQQYISNMYRLMGFGMWLVCDIHTGEIIGRAGLETHDYGEQTGLEMGYLLRKDYRGKGLATRVCRSIIEFAKRELSYPEVNCLIHSDNTASIALAERLGMKLDGKIDNHGKEMFRYRMKLRGKV